MKRVALPLLVTGALVGLSACGTTEAAPQPAGSETTATTTAGGGGPVSVVDSRGKTISLPKPATRVVVLEWGEAEMVASLGVTPVGVADVKGYATWNAAQPLDASVKDVGTRGEPSLDAVLALEPEVVIGIEDLPATVIAQLESSVPVYVADATDASRNLERLRGEVTALGSLLGRASQAKDLLTGMDVALSEGKAQVDAAGAAGTPFLMMDGWKEGSSIALRPFGKGSLVSEVGEKLGLANAWTGKVDAQWGLGQTDVEGLTAVEDPRTHLFYSASENDVITPELTSNAILRKLPFSAPARAHKLDKGTWTFGGPSSVRSIATQLVSGVTTR